MLKCNTLFELLPPERLLIEKIEIGDWQILSFVIYLVHGALAQLGARNIRIVKATGSTPVCSIFY